LAGKEAKSRRAELQQQKLKFDDTDGKAAADSHITFSLYLQVRKMPRMASLANDRKIYRKTAGRLRTELSSDKIQTFVDCASVRSLITEVFSNTCYSSHRKKWKPTAYHQRTHQSTNGGWLSLVSKEFFWLWSGVLLPDAEIVFNKTNGIGMAMHRQNYESRGGV
jgi:hypothetical protein